MKCKECSELLVEYLHKELTSELESAIRDHLGSCSECSKEFREYSKIQRAAQEQLLPEVSPEVLAKISKAASDSVRGYKPFWKKWSYSPILVPALTTAIALSVWFYFGYDAIKIKPELTNIKVPVEAFEAETDSGAQITDDNSESENVVVAKRSDMELKYSPEGQSQEPRMLAREVMPPPPPPAPAPAPENEVSGDMDIQKGLYRERQHQLSGSQDADQGYKSKTQSQTARVEQEETEAATHSTKNESADSAQKKRKDECKVSIKANEALVNSTPPAPLTAQQQSYRELAECYESQGDYDLAITNYINLLQVDPEQSSFANSRIEAIQNRIKLDHLRKEQMSEPAPAN